MCVSLSWVISKNCTAQGSSWPKTVNDLGKRQRNRSSSISKMSWKLMMTGSSGIHPKIQLSETLCDNKSLLLLLCVVGVIFRHHFALMASIPSTQRFSKAELCQTASIIMGIIKLYSLFTFSKIQIDLGYRLVFYTRTNTWKK